MLEYQITNFKAFAGPANIPIKPITLIFGPNSSGKSAILQSMLMLKQTIEESRDWSIALLPKGNMVDLGSFREFIYRHDVDRSFSFKMTFPTPLDLTSLGYRSDERFFPNDDTLTLEESIDSDTIGVGITFTLDRKTSNTIVSKINLYIGDDPDPIVSYEGGRESLYDFKGNFNANKCISYLTIEHNGDMLWSLFTDEFLDHRQDAVQRAGWLTLRVSEWRQRVKCAVQIR